MTMTRLTIILVLALVLLSPRLARAQFGTGAIAVQDLLTEQFTEEAAYSLLTGGGAGLFQAQSGYLNALMQTMSSGIADPGTFAAMFPGWVDFGPDAATLAAQITQNTMQTYANVMSVAQSQAGDFAAEDTHFGAIEGCNAAALSVLQAIQCNTEAQLATAQQIQLSRQLQITQLILDAVHHGQELDEKAQKGANEQTGLLTASQQ